MKKDPLAAQIFPDPAQLTVALDLLRRERFADASVALSALPQTPEVLWQFGVALHGQNQHAEALRVLRQARAQLSDPLARLRCTIDIAITHNKRGAASYAHRLLRRCQHDLLRVGDRADQLKCALYLAITLARRGRYEAFLDAHAALSDQLEALGQPDLIVIGLATACACLTSLHRYDEARQVIARGVPLARKHDLVYRLALFEYYRCRIGYETGEGAPSEGALSEDAADALEQLCALSGAALLKTDCLTLRTQIAYARGDLVSACVHTERARDAFHALGYVDGAAVCGVNLAVLWFLMGRYSAALDVLERAAHDAVAGQAHDTLATAHFWAGWIHATLNNVPLARVKLTAALDAYTELGQRLLAFQTVALLALVDEPRRAEWLAQGADLMTVHRDSDPAAKALTWLAEAHLRAGDAVRAAALLEDAAQRFVRMNMRIEHCGCELVLCALALQSPSADHVSLRARIATARADVRGIPELDSQAALLEAEILQLQGHSARALDILSEAAALATEVRTALFDPVLAGRVAALQARNYAMGLALAFQSEDVACAIRFAGSRRQASGRWRAESKHTEQGGAGCTATSTELDILTRNRLRLRLARSTAGSQFGALPLHVLQEMEFDARQMARVLPVTVPSPALRSLAETRARLCARFGDNWTLVSIEPLHPVTDAWLLVRVTPQTETMAALSDTAVSRHLLRVLSGGDRTWRDLVYAPARSGRSIRQQIARWLELDRWFPAVLPQGHTLVLADTAPFSAIGLGALPFEDGRMLADCVNVLHAPQIWSDIVPEPLAQSAQNRRGARVLIVAPGTFGNRHQSLPESQYEVEHARLLWPDAVVLAEGEATLAAMRELHRSGSLSAFDLIVFATHATYFEPQPRLSALALADGEVSVHEMSDWHLNAQLVCVSACDSARAVVYGGEERLGIEHTLLQSGARHVVSPIWQVDDRAARLVATSILTEYHAGYAIEHAFHRAMTATRGRLAGADWAPWRHTGHV